MSKNPSMPTTPSGSAGLPASLTVAVDSGQGWGGWGNGTYTRCTSTPCGHLDTTTFSGREVYVKVSGQSTDQNNAWYYAYIFKKNETGNTWPIQYVMPSDQWNAHRYYDSVNPWGDWGDLTVTANYTVTSTPTPAPTATPSGSAGLPTSLSVAVDSGQGWGSWGNGTYTRCTGVPCGALDVSTWNGEAIYVKPSGVTSDPTHHWYWAYIDKFRPSGYTEVWTIAYVAPRFDASDPDCARDGGWCWNVHNACGGCSDPWGDWGDLIVTANY